MSSEIKADKWSPASGTSATIGDLGDTYTVPSGVTFNVASGATIANSGTATGFGDTAGAVLINASAATTGDSELNLNNVFSSTYEVYVVDVIGYQPSTAGYLLGRIGTGSPSYQTGNKYYFSGFGKQDDNTNVDNYSNGVQNKIYFNPTAAKSSDGMNMKINIYVPTSSSLKPQIFYTGAYMQDSGPKSTAFFGQTWFDDTTDITSIQFFPSAGTITNLKTKVYGFNKSV